MAIDYARQLLDELMGRERNQEKNEKAFDVEWDSDRVCKFHLVSFCPNQLFINTKADIGPCNLIHDDFIKRAFKERASRREKNQLEDDFIKFCQQTLADVERRIKRAKQRLAASRTEKANQIGYKPDEETQEKITYINEKIEALLQTIEQLGCEGRVEEAQGLMEKVDSLKEEEAAIKRENQSSNWVQHRAEIGVAQEKQMEVCDVCGAFLIVNDVQQRVDDHLMGKQHVGYGKLRSALDSILEKRHTRQNDDKGHHSKSRSRSRSPVKSERRDRRSRDSKSRDNREHERRRRKSRSRSRNLRHSHRYKSHRNNSSSPRRWSDSPGS